jgi:hypothetical protein
VLAGKCIVPGTRLAEHRSIGTPAAVADAINRAPRIPVRASTIRVEELPEMQGRLKYF